jgi:hypothetical protein
MSGQDGQKQPTTSEEGLAIEDLAPAEDAAVDLKGGPGGNYCRDSGNAKGKL